MEIDGCVVESWIDPELILSECHNLCPEVLESGDDLSPFFAKAASYFYWKTGFRWPGCCLRVAEPCWEDCRCGGAHWDYRFQPMMINGQWMNLVCGCAGAGSCCDDEQGIPLVPGPVKEIVSVVVDGVALGQTQYKCNRAGLLVRTDGGEWPTCGGIRIEYMGGAEPPEWVACAAREYARELLCECYCPSKCNLPGGWSKADFGDITVESSHFEITPSIDRVLNDPIFVTPSGLPRQQSRVITPDLAHPAVGYPI